MDLHQKSLTLILRIAAAVIISAACLVLLGWLTGISVLTSFIPAQVAMNPTTAIMFLVCTCALQIRCDSNEKAPSRIVAILGGAAIVVCSVAVILGFLLNWEMGIDRVIFATDLHGNRMAPNTAVHFLLVGLALLTAGVRIGPVVISQYLALVVFIGAFTSLLGYVYGARHLYGIANHIPMAVNTSILFILLAVAILASAKQHSLLTVFFGNKIGDAMIRRMLPIAIIVPCVLGYLRILGQNAGWYDTEFGAAIMAVMTAILLAMAVLLTAKELSAIDNARLANQAVLREVNLQLQSQTQILQAILNSMGDGVVVANAEGEFVLFNPAAQRILGVGAVDSEVESWSSHFGCYLPDKVTPYPSTELPLARAVRGENVVEEEMYICNANKENGLWISIAGRPLSETYGGFKGGIIVFREITERKRIEDALRYSHDQLERRVAERTKELAQINIELSHKNQENEMFVYSVSHDLRSPLVNLQGFGEELSNAVTELKSLLPPDVVPPEVAKQVYGLLDNDVSQSIRFIQLSVSRLGNIIEALLRLSRVGRIEYQCKSVDLQSHIKRLVESMRVMLSDADVSVQVGKLRPCYGDATALEQIFANLIINAVKYRDPHRPCIVEIGCVSDEHSTDEDFNTYFVKDNGLGIPLSHQDKIFQAFKRAHPKIAEGEGIGLTVVKKSIERHGGRVWVQSDVGCGSTFFVSLPANSLKQSSRSGALNISETPYHMEMKDDRKTHDHLAG